MSTAAKNWDDYVVHAEEVARSAGFLAIRDRIFEIAAPQPSEVTADIGAGTGLLTLPFAARSREVWAIDISPAMTEYIRVKALSAGLQNVQPCTASAISLPLVDGSVDIVVSNYCFHHLDEAGKHRALAEVHRVLRPGGRLVFGDMMFRVSLIDSRDRRVMAQKVRGMLAKGPSGVWRLARNGMRFATGRWESPARAEWWYAALQQHGFESVKVDLLPHEGGIASARRSAGEITEPSTADVVLPSPVR